MAANLEPQDLRILTARGIIVDAVLALARALVDRNQAGPDEIYLADQILECALTYVQTSANGGLAAIERDKVDRITDDMVGKIQQLAISIPRAHNGA